MPQARVRDVREGQGRRAAQAPVRRYQPVVARAAVRVARLLLPLALRRDRQVGVGAEAAAEAEAKAGEAGEIELGADKPSGEAARRLLLALVCTVGRGSFPDLWKDKKGNWNRCFLMTGLRKRAESHLKEVLR